MPSGIIDTGTACRQKEKNIVKLRHLLPFLLAAEMLLSAVLAAGCTTADQKTSGETTAETVKTEQPSGSSAEGENKTKLPEAPEGTIFGAQKITNDELVDLTSGKKYVDPDELKLQLYYDYAKLPGLSDGKTFFLTVDGDRTEGESWGKGSLSANIECTFAFLESDTEPDSTLIMRTGSRGCMMLAEDVYTASEIIFTTLPVMTIDTDKGRQITTDDMRCAFSVFTPRNEGSVAYTDESAAMIRIRGASSASLPKTSFKLTLYKSDYSDSNKLPLLGMRRDDDWILYASYSDEAKIRDATGWELWRRMGAYIVGDEAQGTINLRYTEVILNARTTASMYSWSGSTKKRSISARATRCLS